MSDYQDDSLEYNITVNSDIPPSQHLKSINPSIFWVSTISEMQQIPSSVTSLVIQGRVGRGEEKITFNLSNLPNLTTLEMGCDAFGRSTSIVFESDNDE